MAKDARENEFTIGIVGVGSLGDKTAVYLLRRFPSAHLNIVMRPYKNHFEFIKRSTIENIAAGAAGERLTLSDSLERMRKIQVHTSTDGSLDADGSKRRFKDAEYVIVACRNSKVPFHQLKERIDEYYLDKEIIENVAEGLRDYKGLVIVLTNPVELTSELIARQSKIPRNRIVGCTYVDTSRFVRSFREVERAGRLVSYALQGGTIYTPEGDMESTKVLQSFAQSWGLSEAELLEIPKFDYSKDLDLKEAIVIGEHGPMMVPTYSLVKFKGKSFLESPMNTSGVRKIVDFEVKRLPTRIQIGNYGFKLLTGPAMAAVKTIESLLDGTWLPMSSYDGDCFITGLTRSEVAPDGSRVVVRDESLLDRIDYEERQQYVASKHSIMENLLKVGL